MEELIGNSDTAKEEMMECSDWINNNHDKIAGDHDVYETIWPLYLYYTKLNQQEEISKYLNLAYENIGKKKIEEYHSNPEKGTHPRFFYCRDIIQTYEKNLNQ